MINYKHLHYFWAVASEGGVARASERLHLTPQTSCAAEKNKGVEQGCDQIFQAFPSVGIMFVIIEQFSYKIQLFQVFREG